MAPPQQISVLKKEVSRLKAELLCKNDLIDELFNQLESQQNELNIEKHERGLLQEKYTKLRQKLAQFRADFEDVCEKLRSHLEQCHINPSSESGSLELMMEIQIELDDLAASLEDGESLVKSEIRKGIRKTLKRMEEVVDLLDSIEEVSTTQTKVTPGKKKAKSGTWTCGICSKSFSNQAIVANHQKNCRLEGPSTSKQLAALLPKKAGTSTSTTRTSATAITTTPMGPPSTTKRMPANQNAIFGNPAPRLAKFSSLKYGTRSLISVVAVTVLEPTKTFVVTKHQRDVTKRHNGFFCYCGMRCNTRHGLDQHRVFHTKNTKKPKKAALRTAIKKERED